MNTPLNELDLQRCVDGELPLGQRRALLEQIDKTGDGWKTLALAFLEQQDFITASSEFRTGPSASPANVTSSSASSRSVRFPIVQCLTLAASVAVAFWLGSQSGRQPVENDHEPVIAANDHQNDVTPTFAPEEADDSESVASLNQMPRGLQPTAVLKLPLSGTENEELAIPVYDQKTLATEEGPDIPLWPAFDKSTALSQPGYRVTSEKNLLSIPLASGDTVFVPVEVSGVTYAVQ